MQRQLRASRQLSNTDNKLSPRRVKARIGYFRHNNTDTDTDKGQYLGLFDPPFIYFMFYCRSVQKKIGILVQ